LEMFHGRGAITNRLKSEERKRKNQGRGAQKFLKEGGKKGRRMRLWTKEDGDKKERSYLAAVE